MNDYKFIFDNANAPMIVINQKNEIVIQNKSFRRFLGYEVGENLVGIHPEDISPMYQPNGVKSSEQAQINNAKGFKEGTYEFSWVLKCKDGHEFLTKVHLDAIKFGGELCLFVLFIDIDDEEKVRKLINQKSIEIEEKNRYLESMFKNTLVGLLVTNEEGIMVNANPKMIELFNYNNYSELIGQSTKKLYFSEVEYNNMGRLFMESFNKGNPFKIDYRFRANQDKEIWCTVAGSPLDEALPPDLSKGILWVFDDITDKVSMQKALEEQYLIAKDANPLTGLPGNNTIKKRLQEAVEERLDKGILYLDLNNFKAYNDKYGFVKGDEVLRKTAQILLDFESVDHSGSYFIGHIGGDDFVAITSSSELKTIAERIISKFDSSISEFYSLEDIEAGYIASKDRNGTNMQFPIMGISVVGVCLEDVRNLNYIEVMDICSEMKSKAKLNEKSTFILNHRKM